MNKVRFLTQVGESPGQGESPIADPVGSTNKTRFLTQVGESPELGESPKKGRVPGRETRYLMSSLSTSSPSMSATVASSSMVISSVL